MTAFWKDLYALLQTFDTVTALVGTRVYPLRLPPDPGLPALVVQKISKLPLYSHDGVSETESQFYQIRTWDDTHEGAVDLADVLEGLLSGYSGGMGFRNLGAVFLLNRIDGVEPKTGLFSQILDFQLLVDSGINFPITINFDGDETTFFDGGWSESGGNVLNDQIALGSELWDGPAAIFTSGTYAWAALGGNTIANVANALQTTYVDSQNGATVLFQNAADLTADLTRWQWYQFQLDQKINLGSYMIRVFDGVTNSDGENLSDTSFEANIATLLAKSATACQISMRNMGAGEVITFDNLSLRLLAPTSVLNNIKSQFGIADGFFIDVYINAVTTGTQLGVIWNYDGSDNFGLAYMNGRSLIVEKNVAGTYSNLASVAQAVTQDQILRIENPAGSNVLDILYNGVSKATPTISDAGIISNTGIALFSSEANNAISKVVIGRL